MKKHSIKMRSIKTNTLTCGLRNGSEPFSRLERSFYLEKVMEFSNETGCQVFDWNVIESVEDIIDNEETNIYTIRCQKVSKKVFDEAGKSEIKIIYKECSLVTYLDIYYYE